MASVATGRKSISLDECEGCGLLIDRNALSTRKANDGYWHQWCLREAQGFNISDAMRPEQV